MREPCNDDYDDVCDDEDDDDWVDVCDDDYDAVCGVISFTAVARDTAAHLGAFITCITTSTLMVFMLVMMIMLINGDVDRRREEQSCFRVFLMIKF